MARAVAGVWGKPEIQRGGAAGSVTGDLVQRNAIRVRAMDYTPRGLQAFQAKRVGATDIEIRNSDVDVCMCSVFGASLTVESRRAGQTPDDRVLQFRRECVIWLRWANPWPAQGIGLQSPT